jgi:hypothetical protein
MGRPRSELQTILKDILGSDHVYFQPPPNVALVYPCIVYNRDLSQTEFADNAPYAQTQRYQVTVIDRDPDSDIPPKVAALPLTLYIRFYAADDLNHDVFNLFF